MLSTDASASPLHSVLVADVGGTSARLATVGTDGVPTDPRIYRNDAFPGFEALIEADLAARAPEVAAAIRGVMLAVAGPADGDHVRLTNRGWSFSKRAIRRRFGWTRFVAMNDFEALAYGVPAFTAADLVTVGGGHADPRAPMLVCGPGTGFGVAGLIRTGGTLRALTGEGGRARLGATNAEEARLVAHLARELGPVVVEHALSGSGLARIHALFAGETLAPEEVIAAARRGEDGALETCRVFLRLFGRIAGDLALTIDARGGVFLAGGVSAALAAFFNDSPFREAFEEHPPHEGRLVATPVSVIVHPTPGLIGCAQVGARLARALAR